MHGQNKTRNERKIMKLLHIDSSPLAANSVSRQLTERIAAQWRATHPGTSVDYLDLARDAPNSNLSRMGVSDRSGAMRMRDSRLSPLNENSLR